MGILGDSNMPKPGSIKKQPDDGTLVDANEAALVFGEDGELRLILPDYEDDNDIPPGALLLAAVLVRAEDENWTNQMSAFLLEHYADDEESGPLLQ